VRFQRNQAFQPAKDRNANPPALAGGQLSVSVKVAPLFPFHNPLYSAFSKNKSHGPDPRRGQPWLSVKIFFFV
jgi:hypothetical protein